ncbi:MAG: phospho-N-acetylmuramoyl-pentapeptide-transferase [Lachnospiraceae bacterium]|nr:phospho-N-acetylmuramoyl-pentapeptide-transferase [Lachnospiraceae bacterium]
MIYDVLGVSYNSKLLFLGIIVTFLTTVISISFLKDVLPHDGGREFAVNGQLSKGKPRGAGIVFVFCFVIMSLIFVPVSKEYLVYCVLIIAAMLSGYLDDRSDVPWNEYKKGAIDLLISLLAAVTFVNFNKDTVGIFFKGEFYNIPSVIYVILATILIWVSINVTNCSDGVDGLCGSLSLVSLFTVFIILSSIGSEYSSYTLIIMASILGYLWFNISPSKLLMGDAGSRALGFVLGVLAMKTLNPVLYILFAFMLIVDGGLGLIKVFLLRFLKIAILKNVRTPIHDHARKNKNWSDAQVVYKFVVVQFLVSSFLVFCIL